LGLAASPAWLVTLVKPQFEVGRARLVKGVVKDTAALTEACEAVRACVEALDWISLGLIPSPVTGGDGAREFLYAARHG
jgi:23S rRNA (cytidine1920-2'-O)/16S rRNA (cytidine1409-2'-O)-methyltransferase